MLNHEDKYLFKFAWKSIRRNAGRSFFIGFSVALAVFIAVWVVAFFEGLNSQIERAVVNTNMGFFQLQDENFSRSTDSAFPRELTPELVAKMVTPIKSYSPELVLDGNISTPEGATGLVVLGVDPKLHSSFLPIANRTKKGEFLKQEDSDSIIIGEELARIFKFNVGDQLILNYQDHKGELRSEILIIKGIYHYNGKGFEKRFTYINQKTWQNLFFNNYSGKPLFNRIVMMTDGLKRGPILQDRFKDDKLVMKTWKNLNPEMAVILDFHDGMINFFFVIIGITITMTILTPVRMLWQERLKELKMMTIIGVSKNKFWKIGLFEIIQMIVASSLLSFVILVVVIGFQSHTGIDFRFLNDGISIERAGIKLPGIIYPQLSLAQLIITFTSVFLILGFSYVWSIRSTLKRLWE